MTDWGHPARRAVLGLPLAALAAPAVAVPDRAMLLVPGPEEGRLAQLGRALAGVLSRGLGSAAVLHVQAVGAADGVTAANRFAAATPADGQGLLLLPGAAGQALLIGDGRARFEPRHWPALCGAAQPALLAGTRRLDAPGPLRLALPSPAAPEAAVLLALDLLGRPAQPVFGANPQALLAAGAADARVIAGPGLDLAGLRPLLALGSAALPDPALAELPTLAQLLPDSARPDLMAAVEAASLAMRTEAVLVLPPLTSADLVALWRAAAERWPETGPRRFGPAEATPLLAGLCPDAQVAVAYREWLLRRFNWRPA